MENINPAEVTKFGALAPHWWDPAGELATLHHINPTRVAFIDQHAGLLGKRVLDVGCGGGLLTEAMASLGANVTGIDAAHEAIEVAKLHAQMGPHTIAYHATTVEAFVNTHPALFDAITCLEMLEHVPEPASVLQACHTLLKPNGLLILSTINRHIKAFLGVIVAAEYLLKCMPQGTHHYQTFIKPHELAATLREQSFQIETIKGLSYNPFSHKAHITDDVSINYLMVARKLA